MELSRVPAFVRIGTHVYYPWEGLMFRCDPEHRVFYMKRTGSYEEECIGHSNDALDEMLGMLSLSGLDPWEVMSAMGSTGGGIPISVEEYERGRVNPATEADPI